jgi:hypothetical protein
MAFGIKPPGALPLFGGNTLAIPVEIPTGEVALRLREKGARVFNLWAWE